jgi:phosphoglycerate kinase
VQTLDDLLAEGVRGRRVLVRSDLNVPLDSKGPGPARVADDGRIRASLPTIQALADAGAKVIVLAHLGRPQGEPDQKYTLAPVAERMGELLGWPVPLADFDTSEGEDGGIAGAAARDKVAQMQDSDVLLLENVRFEAAETSKDDAERGALADRLVALASDGPPGAAGSGAYVDDAFGAVHRKHASVFDVAERLPHYAGKLVLDEVEVLRRLAGEEPPEQPYVVVLGGSKVSDKLAVIQTLLPKVDRLLIGGGMCFTFLKAQNFEVGDSLLESEMVETCSQLLEEAGEKIVLPSDIVAAKELDADAETSVVTADQIPAGLKGLDIGPRTVETFAQRLRGARTVFWNGPMGVFERARFAEGTRGVAEAIAALPDALTVVGGGDSAAAVRQLGIDEARFGHISTGGGASLEYLEGKTLPGVAALES